MNQPKKLSFKNTKILATLGPATDTTEKIIELIESGVDGVRLNFSHGNHDYYKKLFENINDACVATSKPIAILQDLQGPKIRVGDLAEPEFTLYDGDKIIITSEEILGTKEIISCSYKGLPSDAQIGNKIYIDDGLIKMEVIAINEHSVVCDVLEGGVVKPHKGINLPGMSLSLPSVTEKDFKDLDYALNFRVDFVALSFVRHPNDIKILRAYLEQKGYQKNIIAKIEKPEAVANIDAIIEEADGIMIARGDLGVELPPEEVPAIQKQLIKKCNLEGKMVITATQMLESMINHPVPTRAETSDVANAVWDGSDVLMLSGETSVGKFPIESVEMMQKILIETEAYIDSVRRFEALIPDSDLDNLFDSVGKGIASMAVQMKASAIVTITRRGLMAQALSRYKPRTQIIALSDDFNLMNKLSLVWGVHPLYFPQLPDELEAIDLALKLMKEKEMVKEGETVIFTSRAPGDGDPGSNIWIRFAKA